MGQQSSGARRQQFNGMRLVAEKSTGRNLGKKNAYPFGTDTLIRVELFCLSWPGHIFRICQCMSASCR